MSEHQPDAEVPDPIPVDYRDVLDREAPLKQQIEYISLILAMANSALKDVGVELVPLTGAYDAIPLPPAGEVMSPVELDARLDELHGLAAALREALHDLEAGEDKYALDRLITWAALRQAHLRKQAGYE